MSRFFASTLSDSDLSSDEELLSSSEEEELLSSEEEENQKELSSDEEGKQEESEEDESDIFGSESEEEESSSDDEGPRRGPSYFLKKSFAKSDDEESESEDETRKVVKSAKDKLLDEMKNNSDAIELSKKKNSWVQISSELEKLTKNLSKAQQQNLGSGLKLFIKVIAGLEDAIAENSGSNKKKMDALNSKAFNTIKQRVKKHIKEFQKNVDLYRQDPEAFEKEDEQAENDLDGTALNDATVNKSSQKTTKLSEQSEGVFQTLRTVIESRGKKNVDINEQVASLEMLLSVVVDPFELISIYLMLIPIRFDLFSNAAYMSVETWNSVFQDISALFKILEENSNTYRVLENAVPTDDIEIQPESNKDGIKEILGSIPSLVERLDDELTKSLQVIDPHTTEYVERLKDEGKIYDLIVRCQLYCELIIPKEEYKGVAGEQLARVVLRRVEHIYYKPVQLIILAEKTTWAKLQGRESKIYPKINDLNLKGNYSDGLLDSLCSILYTQSNSIFRKKAMLCHIYYYAFNDKFYRARDMFLMSHLQSTIHTSDPQLQVLFNRALVQLGLCAFRSGLINDSQQLLQEIATSQRSKELLGQGTQRYQQQQSLVDKQRLLPFHMHINLELLECCFLTASLLIEVPTFAKTNDLNSTKQHTYSSAKSFKRALEYFDRQFFQGPPENAKEHIMHAAKALQKGDWIKASELINSIKIWDLFSKSDELKIMLKSKLQVEGLRTYLFTFKNFYEKLSIDKLANVFQTSEQKVNSVVSKMIFEEEINAALDQKTNSIIFIQGVEVSKLQELALQLADRAGQLAERNERIAAGGHQGSSQSNQQQSNSNNSNNNNNNQQSNQHNSYGVKLAPVTGALDSTPGKISGGALNGFDKRQRKNQSRK
ncbi:hypothetical protein PACTADRAFT_50103 [Pachysolen tannophilus NRRL Y-2460]|uniref:Eukaryotic translation initiation factor 3 subunit C n=1 Tax=Pachysolen tannophilus NRRL Y-2460 TaxID=669874 RepID=A0A1E4TUH6_PACTA|nr:hypothetical protein PACTADRAFT_50103 [Pachysolen tannophilus NRRL Y-2460]